MIPDYRVDQKSFFLFGFVPATEAPLWRESGRHQNKALPVGISLLVSAPLRWRDWRGKTAFNFRVRMGAGGQNNIEINPVFRGMPCFRQQRNGVSTKGKLC